MSKHSTAKEKLDNGRQPTKKKKHTEKERQQVEKKDKSIKVNRKQDHSSYLPSTRKEKYKKKERQ